MSNSIQSFISSVINSTAVRKLAESFTDAASSIYQLDASLTDLQRTSSMTASQLEAFYRSANKTAKELGVTTQQVIDQAAAWSRLGYDSSTAAVQLAKLSSQLTRLSPGMSSADAIAGLDSIIKSYGLDIADVLDSVIENIAVVGSTFSLNNAQMISMLEDSASVMAKGNNTLEETIALAAAALQITGDTSAGDGLKAAALRLQGLNEETQKADDSLKTMKSDLYDLTGISIMKDADTYKGTYQILKEISEVWNSLSSNAQSQSLELIFGNSNSNTGAAILQNFDAVNSVMLQMSKNAGNATAALSSSVETVSSKFDRLKETGTDISYNLFQTDGMKGVLDILLKLAEAAQFLTDKLGLLGTVGLGAFAFLNKGNSERFCPLWG